MEEYHLLDYKQNKSFKYFIFIMLAAIIATTFVFTYSYIYVKNELITMNQEITGLNKIVKIENIVLDIQKLRGLQNISKSMAKNIQKKQIKIIQNSINSKVRGLKNELKDEKEDILSQRINYYLSNVKSGINFNNDFKHLSKLIEESLILIEEISYNSKLSMDGNMKSNILIETSIKILPSLIEYNGIIRGISSSIKGELTLEKRELLIIQLSKIDELFKKLNFIMTLNKDNNKKLFYKKYKLMVQGQLSLKHFTNNTLINNGKISITSYELFELNTKYINSIINFYKINIKELNETLYSRTFEKEKILVSIVILYILVILSILLVNKIFYNKNKDFIKQIEIISITDGLTKLYNRRYFDIEFEKQLKIQVRNKQSLIFVMIDVDHFKQFNDIYGHQSGDNALIDISSCLNETLRRPNDMVFRLGGEEFGLLFNNVSEEQAMLLANKVKNNIENLKIEHEGNSASDFVTISLGLMYILPNCNNNVQKLYNSTDKALYKAKSSGRNKVQKVICTN